MLLTIISIIIGLGLAIFIHELGHFLAAKACNVKVEGFSIGFGPKLFGFKRGETEYAVRIIPLGGYVKMAGEDPASPKTNDPREFHSQPVRKRFFIVGMGVVMNLVLGFVLFVIAFSVGVPFQSPTIGAVTPGSPSWQAGLRSGDTILEVNGIKDADFEKVAYESVLHFTDTGIDLKVLKAHTNQIVDVKISAESDTISNTEKNLGLVIPAFRPATSVYVDGVQENSPAQKAGIVKDDKITAINGKPLINTADFFWEIARSAGKEVELTYEHKGKKHTAVVVPETAHTFITGLHSTNNIVVTKILKTLPADVAGLKAGDRILTINDKPVKDFSSVVDTLNETIGTDITITVLRYNTILSKMLSSLGITKKVPQYVFSRRISPVRPRGFDRGYLGVLGAGLEIGSVDKGSPAYNEGIRTGDTLVGIVAHEKDAENWTKQTFITWEQYDALVNQLGRQNLDFKILYTTPDSTKTIATYPVRAQEDPTKSIGIIGIEGQSSAMFDYITRQYNLPSSIFYGVRDSIINAKWIIGTLGGLFSRKIPPKAMAGPIGIFDISRRVAEIGFTKLVYFFGMLNINLMIVNLLPLPILDGGLLLLLLIEKLKKRPLNEKVVAAAQYASILLLLALIAYLTFNDIVRIFQGY